MLTNLRLISFIILIRVMRTQRTFAKGWHPVHVYRQFVNRTLVFTTTIASRYDRKWGGSESVAPGAQDGRVTRANHSIAQSAQTSSGDPTIASGLAPGSSGAYSRAEVAELGEYRAEVSSNCCVQEYRVDDCASLGLRVQPTDVTGVSNAFDDVSSSSTPSGRPASESVTPSIGLSPILLNATRASTRRIRATRSPWDK
ncbi:MAG: hypothetical protein HUU46_07350 [Candidatus Hydrogenedentes bacterium]|nr:hypothetical protein [Candidatus Hydrogenedentota bacterium]